MSDDYRRTLEEHSESLWLLKEGLQDADALLVFLTAFGSTLRALDEHEDYTNLRTRFLRDFDARIEHQFSELGKGPETVQVVRRFRQKLEQLIDEMDMYQSPRQ